MIPVKNILDYIEKNNGKIKSLNLLKNDLKLSNRFSLHRLENICAAHNVELVIGTPPPPHGCLSYEKGCHCSICKLSCNLTSYALKHFRKTSREFIDQFAKKYVIRYRRDKSPRKKRFFEFFECEFSKVLSSS